MIHRVVLLPLSVGIAGALAFFSSGCRGCSKGNPGVDAGAELVEPIGPNEPVNTTPLPKEAILRAVNPEGLPIYGGPTGVIEGTVSVSGDPANDLPGIDFSRCPDGQSFYSKSFREGPKRDDGSRPLADALVVVTGYSGYVVPERRASKHIAIDPCRYSTRTVDLTFGQTLLVHNRDPSKKMYYAPELSGSAMPALMVAPSMGDPVKLYSQKPGFSFLEDKMGPSFLKADVYTLLQPLHAVTDVTGHYRIDGVPTQGSDGKPIQGLKVNVRLKAINKDVTRDVPAFDGDEAVTVDVTLAHDAKAAPAATFLTPGDAGAVDGGNVQLR